jgi:hypothetical protein
VRTEYVGADGKPWEEEVDCELMTFWNPQAAATERQMGVPPSAMMIPTSIVAYAAPKGELDRSLPLLRAVSGTLRATVEWTAFAQRIQAMRQRAAIDDGAIARAAREHVDASHRRSIEDAQRVDDQIARQRGDLLAGTQRFDEPAEPGTQVQFPAGYRNAWSNGQGKYLLTDDVNFKPADHPLPGDWTAMKPSR